MPWKVVNILCHHHQSQGCLKTWGAPYLLCLFIAHTNLCVYLVCTRCTEVCAGFWPLCSVSSHLGGEKTGIYILVSKTLLLGVTEDLRLHLAFCSVFSASWGDKSSKKAVLNPPSLFIVRSDCRVIVHCIYVRHLDWLGRTVIMFPSAFSNVWRFFSPHIYIYFFFS